MAINIYILHYMIQLSVYSQNVPHPPLFILNTSLTHSHSLWNSTFNLLYKGAFEQSLNIS